MIRFTDNPDDVTPGEYRDECGYIVPAETDYCSHSTGAVGVSPRYSEPDLRGKLSSMVDIYTQKRMRSIIDRPDIDLSGYLGATETQQEWTFEGLNEPIEELADVS